MTDLLKGNFKPKKPVDIQIEDDLNAQFEREALKKLGGSIAFVSKKKTFLYGPGLPDKKAKPDLT